MIILDTNIISEGIRPKPDPMVERWLDSQAPSALFLAGPVVMEQSYGAERYFLKTGSKRYLDYLKRIVDIDYRGRILEFADPAPVVAGRIRAERESVGRPIGVQDAMIAAICLVNGATLATRNVRDFDGLNLKLVNPFEPAA